MRPVFLCILINLDVVYARQSSITDMTRGEVRGHPKESLSKAPFSKSDQGYGYTKVFGPNSDLPPALRCLDGYDCCLLELRHQLSDTTIKRGFAVQARVLQRVDEFSAIFSCHIPETSPYFKVYPVTGRFLLSCLISKSRESPLFLEITQDSYFDPNLSSRRSSELQCQFRKRFYFDLVKQPTVEQVMEIEADETGCFPAPLPGTEVLGLVPILPARGSNSQYEDGISPLRWPTDKTTISYLLSDIDYLYMEQDAIRVCYSWGIRNNLCVHALQRAQRVVLIILVKMTMAVWFSFFRRIFTSLYLQLGSLRVHHEGMLPYERDLNV